MDDTQLLATAVNNLAGTIESSIQFLRNDIRRLTATIADADVSRETTSPAKQWADSPAKQWAEYTSARFGPLDANRPRGGG